MRVHKCALACRRRDGGSFFIEKRKQHRKIFQRKRSNVFGELNMKNTKKLEQIDAQIAKLQGPS